MAKLFNKYAMALANKDQMKASESLLNQVVVLLTPFVVDNEEVEKISDLTQENLSLIQKRGDQIGNTENSLVHKI